MWERELGLLMSFALKMTPVETRFIIVRFLSVVVDVFVIASIVHSMPMQFISVHGCRVCFAKRTATGTPMLANIATARRAANRPAVADWINASPAV